jgi:hypothetical protein
LLHQSQRYEQEESSLPSSREIHEAATRAARFVIACRDGDDDFRLTPHAEPTPFARCFGIFLLHLLGDTDGILKRRRDALQRRMIESVEVLADARLRAGHDLRSDKPFLQLLTFTLSSLAILERIDATTFAQLIPRLLVDDIASFLTSAGTFTGRAQTGNLAMFHGILLLHARDHLRILAEDALDKWTTLHLAHANSRGFWGMQPTMTYLQFQNGYHQYEILHYLHAADELARRAAPHVAAIADGQGHFAPYPGGGGCYDYDAVSLLTMLPAAERAAYRELLLLTASSIISEQNTDGGFCESRFVRPRTPANLLTTAAHAANFTRPGGRERIHYALALQLGKHARVHTHWSRYSRGWDESDLWDTWFRLLAVARIDCAFDLGSPIKWGFINYPGIGWVSNS